MSIGYITDVDSGSPFTYTFSVNLTTIHGYTPKNKKCFCYPYNQITLYNNKGGKFTFKPELFSDLANSREITINYNFILSTNPSLYSYACDYLGYDRYYIGCVSFTDFPLIPYKYDLYNEWIALNKNSIGVSYLSKGVGLATNVASSNAGGVVSSSLDMLGDFAKQVDLYNRPDNMVGVPQGNDLLYSGAAGVFISQETCRLEYIVMIDEYFTHYGYLINETRRPLLQNRINFDYIKTRDINIVGDIPQEDINELESLFNNGLTIWHNHNTFGDYSVANNPRG